MEYKYYLAVFDSKNHAIYLNQALKRKKIDGFELISTPCTIKAGCSYSIKFNEYEQYQILLEEAKLINKQISGFYMIKRSYGRRIIEKLSIS